MVRSWEERVKPPREPVFRSCEGFWGPVSIRLGSLADLLLVRLPADVTREGGRWSIAVVTRAARRPRWRPCGPSRGGGAGRMGWAPGGAASPRPGARPGSAPPRRRSSARPSCRARAGTAGRPRRPAVARCAWAPARRRSPRRTGRRIRPSGNSERCAGGRWALGAWGPPTVSHSKPLHWPSGNSERCAGTPCVAVCAQAEPSPAPNRIAARATVEKPLRITSAPATPRAPRRDHRRALAVTEVVAGVGMPQGGLGASVRVVA